MNTNAAVTVTVGRNPLLGCTLSPAAAATFVSKSIPSGLTRLRTFEYRYNLTFQNTTLHLLEGLPYFQAADMADFRDNFIREVDLKTMSCLQHTGMVRLDRNKIEYLDENVTDLDLGTSNIILENTPGTAVVTIGGLETGLYVIGHP